MTLQNTIKKLWKRGLQMDKKELSTGLAILSTFYKIKFESTKLDIYYSIFKDYDYEDFEKSIQYFMKTFRNPPNNFIPDLLNFLDPKLDDSDAEQIILDIQHKMIIYGRYNTPKLSDLESMIISDCGGWGEVCSSEPKSFEWKVRNLFKNGYTPSGRIEKHLGLMDKNSGRIKSRNIKEIIDGLKNGN